MLILEWTGRNLALEDLRWAGFSLAVDARREGTGGSCLLVRDGVRYETAVVPSLIRGSCTMSLITVRIEWRGRWFSMLGVHAPPPIDVCGSKNDEFLRALARLVEDGRLAEDLGVAKRGDPIAIVGDLNSHPWEPELRAILAAGMVSVDGWRPLTTWKPRPWLPAVLQLDYVLLGRGLVGTSFRVLGVAGSDHRQVVADIGWTRSLALW